MPKLLVALLVALALPSAATAATPIPQNQADLSGLTLFSGKQAKPHPVKAPRVPRHPFMAANGRNAVHNDAYQTDTYRNLGPLGGAGLRLFSQSIDGAGGLGSCGITIAYDKRGRLITTCISATTVELRLMDPELNTVASHLLPPRIIPPGVNPLQSPGGAYFYVDNKDRAVVSIGRQIFVVAIEGDSLRRVRTYDLSAVIPSDDQLNSALPDWSGRLWFVSRRHGIVGALDPASGKVLGTKRTNEAIGNSFAMDETGGVFIVTDAAQYRFDAAPRRQAQGQLARALRQRPQAQAGAVRRRLGHHADADGQAATCRSPTTPLACRSWCCGARSA